MKTGAGVQQRKPSSRRTKRACDGCRIRKTKCSGTVPCAQCQSNNIPCIAQLRSSEIGEQKPLQRQMQYLLFERTRMTRALQRLYKQSLLGVPWQGEPVFEIPFEGPSIHEILQRLEGDPPTPTPTNAPVHDLELDFNLRWTMDDRKVSKSSEVPSMPDSEREPSEGLKGLRPSYETMPLPTPTPTIDPAYCTRDISDSPPTYSDATPPSGYHDRSFYQDNDSSIPSLAGNHNVLTADVCTSFATFYTRPVEFFALAQLERS